MKFDWYITALDINDPFLEVCIFNMRKFSKNVINCILVPERLKESNNSIENVQGVNIKYVDTFKDREDKRGGAIGVHHEGKRVSVNEEHRRLVGYGVESFPSCVIDGDIWLTDDRIDEYIPTTPCSDNSFCLHFKDDEHLWDWHTTPRFYNKHHRYDKDIPFVHVSGSNFLHTNKYKCIETHLSRIVEVFDRALMIEGVCPEEHYEKFKNMKRLRPFLSRLDMYRGILK